MNANTNDQQTMDNKQAPPKQDKQKTNKRKIGDVDVDKGDHQPKRNKQAKQDEHYHRDVATDKCNKQAEQDDRDVATSMCTMLVVYQDVAANGKPELDKKQQEQVQKVLELVNNGDYERAVLAHPLKDADLSMFDEEGDETKKQRSIKNLETAITVLFKKPEMINRGHSFMRDVAIALCDIFSRNQDVEDDEDSVELDPKELEQVHDLLKRGDYQHALLALIDKDTHFTYHEKGDLEGDEEEIETKRQRLIKNFKIAISLLFKQPEMTGFK